MVKNSSSAPMPAGESHSSSVSAEFTMVTPSAAKPSSTDVPSSYINNEKAVERPNEEAPTISLENGKGSVKVRLRGWFEKGGKLEPFKLLRQDIGSIQRRYLSDWKIFNQLVFASAVYVFFTNLLPGITFASDLYVLTGKTWGTIEVVFSTGLCGVIFSL